MESFGKILAETREKKQLSYETVEAETKILKRYLEALESEQFDIFSGETYFLGFLRNYSDYLGCDTNHLINLYHARILQETPVPEGLLKKGKSPFFIVSMILLGLILLGGLVFLGIWGFKKLKEKRMEESPMISLVQEIGQSYSVTDEPLKQRVYEGDIISVDVEGEELSVSVEKTLETLSLRTPIGIQIVELGETLDIDIDGDGIADMSLYLSDISNTDSSVGASVRMVRKERLVAEDSVDESAILSVSDFDTATEQLELIKSNRAFPFTVTANFRGPCLFRYQSDLKESVEDYFANGDKLVFTSNNAARIWISNALTVKLQVQGDTHTTDIAFGKAGQVLVEDIRWIKEPDGSYHLVVLKVD
ncbi:MAG: helix-turn-helix domain-containing protein [Treponemataceae bacterium]|nr:helix-turn-helix domain-containing protein [Treponemataceae bacterium]